MDFSGVNFSEMERQRYNDIKKKGKYLELNILIGTETDNSFNGHTGRMPVITTAMHGCGPEEIACLCATLKTLVDYYKKEYPMEYLFSEMAMGVEDAGTVEVIKKKKKED